MFKIKRVYEKPDEGDGIRVLIDRLWPRGLKKEEAKIDHWMKEISPSDTLRKWFAHKEDRWQEFESRYMKELKDKNDLLKQLIDLGKKEKVTLLYAAKDEGRNNAQVLLEVLKKK
ncbi:hypothetical protein KsCSTR_04790 [Candidatus Kuenenia stuttgartiensis]|jgi:uncharacterized protein YeaO (DUF488 family)|uniref:Uroporphyrin-III C-methyltransferase n=1 Tax=Kuenenia stuttgartiensis TaxID=174633 RepID=Q1Q096_KUEST|nr:MULTISPECIES: DUF488 family protein [Kuenenia]MBE7546492.1 DUF488 family protein [Planctomycetia bacterium]MBZ0193224.1 DUF488 family protein [Candidatus Kuenenia stuttgartiensis]MCL4728609.1 DUF488 family protein [Candidatus Kuenenia stuttgartiensis]MCZ7621878.1 DUF488 family protein [Candidatus Kuenenia sp.]QII09858.1 hypothetical protein KsCSTR_04790 [Candidatus Kuenenia stuttgartiensis]